MDGVQHAAEINRKNLFGRLDARCRAGRAAGNTRIRDDEIERLFAIHRRDPCRHRRGIGHIAGHGGDARAALFGFCRYRCEPFRRAPVQRQFYAGRGIVERQSRADAA